MAKIQIDKHLVFTYEYNPYKEMYWDKLSEQVLDKYGDQEFDDYKLVDDCLNDCFVFFISEFESILSEISNFKFFCYVFTLHEDSLKLMIKERSKELDLFKMIDEAGFAAYRRIVKVILEQGCLKDLEWGQLSAALVTQFDETLHRLFYLGRWMYNIADNIAYHRMLNGAYYIKFEDGDLIIHWKNNYGTLLSHLMKYFSKGYETDVVDGTGTADLRAELEKCYGINYNAVFGLVFQIKKHHSHNLCQTIEPYLLPQNIKENFKNLSGQDVDALYEGLTISRNNCLSLTETILKPYCTQRFLFRPYLVYTIGNEPRLLTSEDKFAESMYVLATNAIQWNTLNPEWENNKCLRAYKTRKGNEHDKHLEDKIEGVMLQHKIPFARNIKSFMTETSQNLNIDNSTCGEIDFIIIDIARTKVIVADSKYNKARYEAVGYRQDFSNFNDKNVPQLCRKVKWISSNLSIVDIHFKKLYPNLNIDLTEFDVMGLFLINTPTFYMFCSDYLTIASNYFEEYILGKEIYPQINIEITPGVFKAYPYPYFKNH